MRRNKYIMEITSIRIKRNNNSDNKTLLGYASVQFDNCFIVHDIRLIQLDGKRIISFPTKKTKKYIVVDGEYKTNDEYIDIVHPTTTDFRRYVEAELYKLYDAENVDCVGGDINE